MRNPKWHRDEVLLALDLYFKLELGQIHARNPAIIELSPILNALPLSELKTNAERFLCIIGWSLGGSRYLGLTGSRKEDRNGMSRFGYEK